MLNFLILSDSASELRKIGINTFLPDQEEFEARDKVNLFSFGKKHDLLIPADKVIYQISEIPRLLKNSVFRWL